jgi:glutamyl-tRNA synthetase
LMKSDGYPTYHLANVVDDHDMEITHIMRAEEWISSAPVHRQLYDAFGWDMPHIAHLPVILNPNGKGKLSKRSARFTEDGRSIPILLHEFREEGYIPPAILNFLANTGWSIGEDQEIFSVAEAIKKFELERIGVSGTAFNIEKLQWLNGVHIRMMSIEELAKLLKPELEAAGYEVNVDVLLKITPHVQERLKTLNEIVELTAFLWKEEFEPVTPNEIIQNKMDAEGTRRALETARDILANLPDFSHETQENAMRELVAQLQLKPNQLFGALRMAIIAQKVSPPLFQSMEIIGRDVVLQRLNDAIKSLDVLISA